jgi:LemA protein
LSVIVTVVLLLLVLFWILAVYNRLIKLRRQVINGWRQIDTQLRRRHDLVSTLITTVRGEIDVAPDAIEAVIAARNHAVSARAPGDLAQQEGQLTQALARFFALAANDAQLTSHHKIQALQQELADTESQIRSARQTYNSIATKYNASMHVVPNNLIAGFGNFKPAELFASA